MTTELYKRLELSLSVIMKGRGKGANNSESYGDWDERAYNELKKILGSDNKIKSAKIKNFMRNGVFVTDNPTATIKGYTFDTVFFNYFIRILMFLTGYKRAGMNEAKLTFDELKNQDMLGMLEKYPMPDTGNPLKIKFNGHKFTNRYLRHIYFISVFKKYLIDKLPTNPIIMDIGGSYGLFQRFVKKEITNSHNILVEIPGQLILAQYYLQKEFPESKIADLNVLSNVDKIDESFIRKYDFVLLPTTMYDKLEIDNIDVVTNFVSLSEMSKKWFDAYLSSNPFRLAKFFFTVNRYDSFPTYSNGITIYDYPLHKYKKVTFKTLPILKYYFIPLLILFTKKVRFSSELFQFIGEKVNDKSG